MIALTLALQVATAGAVSADSALARIHNYVAISDRLATSGQMTYDQIEDIANAGFDLVINLAPARKDRNEREGFLVAEQGITYVNVTGVKGDAATGAWSRAKVIFTLKAPETPGDYPLGSVYLYGTEKASALGFTVHPIAGYAIPRGGFLGKSGRVKFSEAKVLSVRPPPPSD